jgi:hypothetical protein
MAKTKKQLKIEQANMQSDNIEMTQMSSNGIENTGDFTYSFADLDDDLGMTTNTGGVVKTATVDTIDSGFTFSYNDVGLDVFDEMELQDKYPALKQAHEHYKSVLEICKTKEKEENED